MNARRWIGIAAVVAVVLAVVVLSITVAPGLLVDPLADLTDKERLDAQNDIRQTLLQAIAGLVLLAGGIATWVNIRIAQSRRDLEEERRQLEKQGQVTERFTRAVGQLGNTDSEDVRIGGVYALERIARDSADDRRAIAHLLAAFVRGHAPRHNAEVCNDGPDDAALPTADVQAALTAICRFPPDDVPYRFDLRNTDLRNSDLLGVDLDSGVLQGAILRRANLVAANLVWVNLRGADLTDANLREADLGQARLSGATLRAARLDNARLGHVDLEDLQAADLRGAVADSRTQWPASFDWQSAGVTVEH